MYKLVHYSAVLLFSAKLVLYFLVKYTIYSVCYKDFFTYMISDEGICKRGKFFLPYY